MASNAPTFSPLYRQIKSLIVQALESGEWRPGEAIPSEQELAARFGVSQGTVRKAVDELAAENVLVRKQGKGTFVVSHHDPRQFFRFLRLVPDDGSLTQPQSVPLDCWRAKAGQEAARVLQIPVGDPIIILRRVLKFSGKPVVLDEIYLPGRCSRGSRSTRSRSGKARSTVSSRRASGCACCGPRSTSAPWPPTAWRPRRWA